MRPPVGGIRRRPFPDARPPPGLWRTAMAGRQSARPASDRGRSWWPDLNLGIDQHPVSAQHYGELANFQKFEVNYRRWGEMTSARATYDRVRAAHLNAVQAALEDHTTRLDWPRERIDRPSRHCSTCRPLRGTVVIAAGAPFDEVLAAVAAARPTHLVGYPSVIGRLARAALAAICGATRCGLVPTPSRCSTRTGRRSSTRGMHRLQPLGIHRDRGSGGRLRTR
jgi:hypothetical protein